MTVIPLDTPFQLPRADMDIISNRRGIIGYQMQALSTVFLSSLAETIDNLRQELANTDQKALLVLSMVPAALKSNSFDTLINALATLSKDPSADGAAEAIEQLTGEVRGQINAALAEVRLHWVNFDHALTNLGAIRFTFNPTELAEREDEINGFGVAIEQGRTKLDAIQNDIQALKTLIDLIEGQNMFDRLKPLVASLEVIANINPEKPLVGAIKAALKGVENILNLASEAVKYEHLIGKRDLLHKDEQEVLKLIQQSQERSEITAKQLKELKGFISLAQPVAAYSQEISKIGKSVELFVQLNYDDESEAITTRCERFKNNSSVLINHLNDQRRDWIS
ncbi:MAG: alpha-xenorhabdolysin family binary toxin subunit B [Pseudomonas sp.]